MTTRVIFILKPLVPCNETYELLSFTFEVAEILNVANVIVLLKYALPIIIQIPVGNDSEKILPLLELETTVALRRDPKNAVVSVGSAPYLGSYYIGFIDQKVYTNPLIVLVRKSLRIFTLKTIAIMKKIDLPFFSTLSYDVSLS